MQKLFLFLVFTITLISCDTAKTIPVTKLPEKTETSYLDGSWKLEMLFASDNKWARTPLIAINFKDRSFTGNSGCNSISGKFTISGSYFAFDKNILSTKMACADVKANQDERAFLDALLKINTYIIKKDEMELGQGDIVIMRFKRS